MRDLVHNISTVNIIPPQAVTSSPIVTSVIDLLGFDSAAIAIQAGAITDGSYAVTLTAGDAADGSDQASAAASVIGTLPSFAATDDNATKRFGYAGNRRYLKVTLTGSGITAGGLFAAVAVLGNPSSAPVA